MWRSGPCCPEVASGLRWLWASHPVPVPGCLLACLGSGSASPAARCALTGRGALVSTVHLEGQTEPLAHPRAQVRVVQERLCGEAAVLDTWLPRLHGSSSEVSAREVWGRSRDSWRLGLGPSCPSAQCQSGTHSE